MPIANFNILNVFDVLNGLICIFVLSFPLKNDSVSLVDILSKYLYKISIKVHKCVYTDETINTYREAIC